MTQSLRSIKSCNGEDKEKEIELHEDLVRTKGILKYFQSKLASCEEVCKKLQVNLMNFAVYKHKWSKGKKKHTENVNIILCGIVQYLFLLFLYCSY